ncbi:MAG: PD-(D/E)XK nuclease family protein, partial [Candidatus Rokuibacteriota bacterium]
GESGDAMAAAHRLVERALASEPYRRAAGAKRVIREMPVAAVVDGALVEGVIDLVFEAPDGLVVVEVKGAPPGDEAADQLRAYCRALAAAGVPVAEAYLLVLAPDGARVVPVPG